MSAGRIHLLLPLVFVLIVPAAGQDRFAFDPRAEEHFTYAVGMFERGQYLQSAEVFSRFLRRYPASHRTTAAYVMGAKAYLRAGRPSDAAGMLKPLFIRFPKSLYLDEALFLLSQADAEQEEWVKAAEHLAILFSLSQSDSARRASSDRLVASILPRLSASSVDSLIASLNSPEAEWFLRAGQADYYYDRGDLLRASSAADAALAIRPTRELTELSGDIRRERGADGGAYKIAVVLPDARGDPAGGAIIEDVYRGLRTAVSRSNASRTLNLEPVRVRYSGDPAEWRSQLAYLADDPRVLAVIGGIFSNDTRELAAEAANFDLPFVAPTATANGIAEAGKQIFQFNPDYATRGAAIAEYCRNTLQARRAAIIAPLDGYGKALAEGFLRAAKKRGLTVEVVSWFNPTDLTLANNVFTIRKSWPPPDSIDVLYAPIGRREQIVEIVTQCLEQGVRTHIVGSGDWNNPAELRLLPQAGLPVDFEGDLYVEDSGAEWKAFQEEYARLFHEPVSKHAVMGYDAAGLLCDVIHGGRLRRESIRDRLAAVTDYHGVRGPVAFSSRRVSRVVPVLRYDGGRISKITDIFTGE